MREWLWRFPPLGLALSALAVGVGSGLIAANVFGAWIQVLAIRTGHPCSPCPPASVVESAAPVFREFRPNADVGLAVGVAVAMIVLVIWAVGRRAPTPDGNVSR